VADRAFDRVEPLLDPIEAVEHLVDCESLLPATGQARARPLPSLAQLIASRLASSRQLFAGVAASLCNLVE